MAEHLLPRSRSVADHNGYDLMTELVLPTFQSTSQADNQHDVMSWFPPTAVRSTSQAQNVSHRLADLAIDDYFRATLGRFSTNHATRADEHLLDDFWHSIDDELNPRNETVIDRVFNGCAKSRLLDDTASRTTDAGSGTDDELDLLLGDGLVLRVDAATGELKGSL